MRSSTHCSMGPQRGMRRRSSVCCTMNLKLRTQSAFYTTHFFLPPLSPSSLRSQEITFPSMTTPLPSINATRERPSQFLKVSHTSGCWGWKLHWAISFDFNEWGSSIFLPPVSLPIFHFNLEIRHAERPQRTKPIGEPM